MRIGSLFAGIGGLELGLERAGLGHTVWQVERDPYCTAVLAKHWPTVERFTDVRDFHPARGTADVICGGFPCQPWSVAGKQLGTADERHLWPEFARIIDEAQPAIVIGENVPGLRARGLRPVLADLAARGFDVEWTDIRASDVGAPHRRERLFIVATHPERVGVRLESGWLGRACGEDPSLLAEHGHQGAVADSDGLESDLRASTRARVSVPASSGSDGRGLSPHVAHTDREGLEEWREQHARGERAPAQRGGAQGYPWAVEPNVGRVAHGIRARVDRLRALGNAVVPQVAEVIGRAIVAAMSGVA